MEKENKNELMMESLLDEKQALLEKGFVFNVEALEEDFKNKGFENLKKDVQDKLNLEHIDADIEDEIWSIYKSKFIEEGRVK